jgi:hypothetical protein
MKALSVTILALFAMAAITTQASAKCQYASDWTKGGKKIIVCVKGDDFSDRKKAQEVCSKIKGSSCSTASTFSSSCGKRRMLTTSPAKNHYSLSGILNPADSCRAAYSTRHEIPWR